MNSINIFSPKIGFPVLYLLINLVSINTISTRVLVVMSIFYLSYYAGVLACQYSTREQSINKLEFERIFYIPQNIKLFKLAKWCIFIYCSVILIQFLRVGIGHTDTFRGLWLDGIPMGQYMITPIALGAHIYIYMLTLKYFHGETSKQMFLFICLAIYACIMLLGSRTVLSVFFFIQFSLFYLCRKISTKKALYLSILALCIMIIQRILTLMYGHTARLQYYLNRKMIDFDSPWQTLKIFLERSMLDMSNRTQKIVDNVPEIVNHTYGKSLFFSYYSILPGEQINPTIMLNHDLFHGSKEAVGYPPTIMAQIYMDFGFLGLIFLPMVIGYIYTYLYFKCRKTGRFFYIYLYITLTFQLLLSCYGEFLTFPIFIFILSYFIIKCFYKGSTTYANKYSC